MPAQPTAQPAKTDRERMVGNWFITNDDSQRKGEMWVITEDSILMHAKDGGANALRYAHRLDAGKNPKQIDITASRVNGPTVSLGRRNEGNALIATSKLHDLTSIYL